jgi:hypothetical protein
VRKREEVRGRGCAFGGIEDSEEIKEQGLLHVDAYLNSYGIL